LELPPTPFLFAKPIHLHHLKESGDSRALEKKHRLFSFQPEVQRKMAKIPRGNPTDVKMFTRG
jgi:hypothetical protein